VIDFSFLRTPIDFELVLLFVNNENVNRLDRTNGSSALMYACQFSSPFFIKSLLDKGADLKLTTHKQMQAMDYALDLSYPRLDNALTLIEIGVDVNYAEKIEGRTALFYAVAAQNMQIIEALLKLKADPRIVTFTGVQVD
jgi:ankyrin repeat protein